LARREEIDAITTHTASGYITRTGSIFGGDYPQDEEERGNGRDAHTVDGTGSKEKVTAGARGTGE
jgi:hypothetical protein